PWAQVDQPPTGRTASHDFLIGKSPFRSDSQCQVPSRLQDRSCLSFLICPRIPGSHGSSRMSQQPGRWQTFPTAIDFPVRYQLDLEKYIASTLLAGLDDVALEFFQLGFPRMNNAAPCLQRYERRNAHFGKFFEQELGPVALGERSSNLKCKRQFALGRVPRDYLQIDAAPARSQHPSRIFVAVAVK